MGCKRWRFELGTSFQAGEGALRPEAEAHVAECVECAEFTEQTVCTSKAVASLGAKAAPVDFQERLRDRLRREQTVARPLSWYEAWSTPVVPARQAYAAAGVLVILIGLLGIAIHGLMPATGFESPVAQVAGNLPTPGGAGMVAEPGMTASFVQPMLRQHQTQQITYPLHHDAGYYMASNDWATR